MFYSCEKIPDISKSVTHKVISIEEIGCLFLTDWMEADGNPLQTYEEVLFLDELKSKY